MRVISQNGRIDIPYDYFSLSMSCAKITSGKVEDRNAFSIVCHNLSSPNGTKLAEYSTEEKAKKAMEMLRDAYQYGKRVAVPKFDESGIDKEDDITLYNTRLINDFFKGGTYVPTKVFQFPKDEDVEE